MTITLYLKPCYKKGRIPSYHLVYLKASSEEEQLEGYKLLSPAKDNQDLAEFINIKTRLKCLDQILK